MPNRSDILRAINHHVCCYYRGPKSYSVKSDAFKQQSYQSWAAVELINKLMKDYRHPIRVVEEFKDEMDELACSKIKDRFMFSVAYDVANDILDLILSIGNWDYPL